MRESDYYAPGTAYRADAPWNDPGDPPEKDFEVTVSQTLSKGTTVTTASYIPGAEGVDYEPDDEGGYYASGWHEEDDTSDTNWEQEYSEEHNTPLQLIELFKEECQKNLKKLEETDPKASGNPQFIIQEKRRLIYLIEECEGWTEDELEVVEE